LLDEAGIASARLRTPPSSPRIRRSRPRTAGCRASGRAGGSFEVVVLAAPGMAHYGRLLARAGRRGRGGLDRGGYRFDHRADGLWGPAALGDLLSPGAELPPRQAG